MNSQIQKLQAQVKTSNAEKDRQVREKSELEARLRHEMSEQVKVTRDRGELQLNETV